jgi:hypothetical protein
MYFSKAESQTLANFSKITGFIGIVHPLVTVSSQETVMNFRDYYTVGFAFGANFWKTNKMAYSMEFIPMVRYENGSSKMYNVIFQPGFVFDLENKMRFITRASFETAGRYGFTPLISKTFHTGKSNNYYISVGLPIRMGNDKPISLGSVFQIGTSF